MPAISVGSVEVDIVPNTTGIYARLKTALEEAGAKAGKDAGLKVGWQTYYGGSPGTVTAVGEAGVDTLKQVSEWHKNATPELDASVVAFDRDRVLE